MFTLEGLKWDLKILLMALMALDRGEHNTQGETEALLIAAKTISCLQDALVNELIRKELDKHA